MITCVYAHVKIHQTIYWMIFKIHKVKINKHEVFTFSKYKISPKLISWLAKYMKCQTP